MVNIEPGNTVSLRLMNKSNLPIRLRKGTKIAHFEPVSQIRKVHLVKDDGRTPRKANEKKTKHIPAHLDDLFNRSTEFLTHEEIKAVLNLLLPQPRSLDILCNFLSQCGRMIDTKKAESYL